MEPERSLASQFRNFGDRLKAISQSYLPKERIEQIITSPLKLTCSNDNQKAASMKTLFALWFALLLTMPAAAQRTAAVRGIGTQTCKSFVAANQGDKQFSLQAAQWILGYLTGYFRQAADDPSRTLSDDVLVKTVLDVCVHNAEKTIDEAVSIAVSSLPTTEIQKPASK